MRLSSFVVVAVVLARFDKMINSIFSQLCEGVIADIVDADVNISTSKFYDRSIVKKDILKYYRFLLDR